MKNLYFLLFALLLITSCGDDSDDEEPTPSIPSVSLEPLTVAEGDDGERAVFASVRLSAASNEVVTIFIETTDGSAKAGEDFLAVSKSLEIAAGLVQENIRLDIIGDEETELDEEFTLSIINVSGATLGSNVSVAVKIENDDVGNGSVILTDDGFASPEEYAGMEKIWSDEFEGASLNLQSWTHEIGNGQWGWGNNELQFYRAENTSLQDGRLVIEAREQSFAGFGYTSSRMVTRDKFEFQYGRVDIRAVLPEGQGIWPALWMLGENINQVGWPRCGEIDIMELVGHQPAKTHSTVHYSNSGGDHIFTGTSTSLATGKKFSDEFHVFSMIWQEDKIEFLVDDELFQTITPNSIGSQNPYPFNQPFFFIMNVAVGGQWPGSPNTTTVFPQQMVVDYVRVFQ